MAEPTNGPSGNRRRSPTGLLGKDRAPRAPPDVDCPWRLILFSVFSLDVISSTGCWSAFFLILKQKPVPPPIGGFAHSPLTHPWQPRCWEEGGGGISHGPRRIDTPEATASYKG